MIAAIKSRYEGHAILVYPDASGGSRKSQNASESDIALLRAARFTVLVQSEQPGGEGSGAGDEPDDPLGMEMRGKRRFRVNADVPGAGRVP
jgi:hypothetical protein